MGLYRRAMGAGRALFPRSPNAYREREEARITALERRNMRRLNYALGVVFLGLIGALTALIIAIVYVAKQLRP